MSFRHALLVLVASAWLPAASPASEPAPSTSAPAATSDRLDTRTPLPLLPAMAEHQKQNMRDHLLAVQQIVAALASDDFAAAERAAARIGYSEQMGTMCTHIGAGAAGFAEQAIAFHRSADRIADAARAHDRTRTLAALGTTLAACTACHATWKQEVVDEATWQRLTAGALPSAPHAP